MRKKYVDQKIKSRQSRFDEGQLINDVMQKSLFDLRASGMAGQKYKTDWGEGHQKIA